MAPSKTAKTPKTTRPAKSPASKKKPVKPVPPNASILSFFKKADESMFVGQSKLPIEALDENELYDDEPVEERYNESQGSMKRRKLNDAEKENYENGCVVDQVGDESANGHKKKVRKGPFLDDSDSDLEEKDTPPVQVPVSVREGTSLLDQDQEPLHTKLKPTPADTISMLDAISRPRSQPPELKHEASTNGDFGGFDELDFLNVEDFEGEEFRERRFMEEQARLEAEEAGDYSCDDELGTAMNDNSMAESCPICYTSLAGKTTDEATVHVNACLDGDPQPPRPEPPEEVKPPRHDQVEAPEISKRFARAAQPRPGQLNPITLGSAGPATASTSAFTKLMSSHAEDAAWATAAAAEHASRGKQAYQRTCPFYKIMPGFFICVDAFRYGAVEGCKAYFLSHFHSDHYVGLTASWNHGPIYCSKVTGSLVKAQLRTAAKWVIEMEFEETIDVPETDGVRVTMIPANHCPGSSLFLFEKAIGNRNPGANGGKGPRMQRILHCGDFRACPAHVEHPLLRPDTMDAVTGKTKQQKIDICYLDTTYLNPRYSFPPQNDVITACAEMCLLLNQAIKTGDEESWDRILHRREGKGVTGTESVSKFFARESDADLKASKEEPNALSSLGKPKPRLLVICGTYSIGKERICKAIALALRTKIFAPPHKRRIVAQLGDSELTELMTSNPAEAQVHMQMLMEMRAETLTEYLESYRPHFGRIVGFRPSGWNYRPTMANSGAKGGAVAANANMPPSSVQIPTMLHGSGWRTSFGVRDLVPQRGSTKDAICFGAPYSEHSSFRELAMFVMALRIEKVVPTVNVGSEVSRRRMKGWLDRWIAERRRGGVVRVLEEDKGEEAGKEKGPREAALWQGKDGKGGGVFW